MRDRGEYAEALAAGAPVVREDSPDFDSSSELEIQARWFAGDMGREWITEGGRRVEVVDFGKWNREPGPDFADVRLRFDDGSERIGAVEIDRDARDWEHHGHAENPAFRETILHLFLRRPSKRFFTRTCDHQEVPQVCLSLPTKAVTRRNPGSAELPITTDPSRARAILLAAARHRMERKAAALRRQAGVRGFDAAAFSALAVALGYKGNQTPFLLLSQRVTLDMARGDAGEAILFGLAGFLEQPEPPAAAPELRTYLRELWENWWRIRSSYQRWILTRSDWRFAPVRPANHPHRRMAALARIAQDWPRVRASFDTSRSEFLTAMEALKHPFWDHRFNLDAARLNRTQTLIGTQRSADMLINIWYPLAIDRSPAEWSSFLRERGPAPAAIMRQLATRLLGGAVDGLLSFAAIQQGLLQLDRDGRDASSPSAFWSRLRAFDPQDQDSTERSS